MNYLSNQTLAPLKYNSLVARNGHKRSADGLGALCTIGSF